MCDTEIEKEIHTTETFILKSQGLHWQRRLLVFALFESCKVVAWKSLSILQRSSQSRANQMHSYRKGLKQAKTNKQNKQAKKEPFPDQANNPWLGYFAIIHPWQQQISPHIWQRHYRLGCHQNKKKSFIRIGWQKEAQVTVTLILKWLFGFFFVVAFFFVRKSISWRVFFFFPLVDSSCCKVFAKCS